MLLLGIIDGIHVIVHFFGANNQSFGVLHELKKKIKNEKMILYYDLRQ